MNRRNFGKPRYTNKSIFKSWPSIHQSRRSEIRNQRPLIQKSEDSLPLGNTLRSRHLSGTWHDLFFLHSKECRKSQFHKVTLIEVPKCAIAYSRKLGMSGTCSVSPPQEKPNRGCRMQVSEGYPQKRAQNGTLDYPFFLDKNVPKKLEEVAFRDLCRSKVPPHNVQTSRERERYVCIYI